MRKRKGRGGEEFILKKMDARYRAQKSCDYVLMQTLLGSSMQVMLFCGCLLGLPSAQLASFALQVVSDAVEVASLT